MDYNITRVVEMFEERFGRFLTTALIALIALALACLSLETIITSAVLPIGHVVAKIIEEKPQSLAEMWRIGEKFYTIYGLTTSLLTIVFLIIAGITIFGVRRESIRLNADTRQNLRNTRILLNDIDASWRAIARLGESSTDRPVEPPRSPEPSDPPERS